MAAPEDILTRRFTDLPRRFHDIFASAWRTIAPPRLARELPDEIIWQGKLGTSKPDILFIRRRKPVFYLEAKVGSVTEPLQLTRARSWMRAYGAGDDQVMLLARGHTTIPSAIGWTGPSLPIRTMLWADLCDALGKKCKTWSPAAQSEWQLFIKEHKSDIQRVAPKEKDIAAPSGHAYGAIFHRLLREIPNTHGDLSFGARIRPRLTFGIEGWRQVLGTRDLERLWLFYDSQPDKHSDERYFAQLIMWHKSDFAYSDAAISRNWNAWRTAILDDERLWFQWGGRQGATQRKSREIPTTFPNCVVGLTFVHAPLPWSNIRTYSEPETVAAVRRLIEPINLLLERVGLRVQKSC